MTGIVLSSDHFGVAGEPDSHLTEDNHRQQHSLWLEAAPFGAHATVRAAGE